MTKTIEITEGQRGLLQICLTIGRDRFREYTTTLAARAAIEQFERQADEAHALIMAIATADTMTITTSDA